MNRLHEKNLRTMLGVSDPKSTISDQVKSRIERAEERLTKFYGKFMEMTVDSMATIISDLGDNEVFTVYEPPAPPKETPEEFIAKMNRGAIEEELEKRGFKLTRKESVGELRELLLESVKEKEKEKEAV